MFSVWMILAVGSRENPRPPGKKVFKSCPPGRDSGEGPGAEERFRANQGLKKPESVAWEARGGYGEAVLRGNWY